MRLTSFISSLLLSCLYAQHALAWGVVGHEVVATIAQVHLFPAAQEAVKAILPRSRGHLAPDAAWADRIRGIPAYRWSGQLHYTGAIGDYPPDKCRFGASGWKSEHDVLHAVSNYTQRLLANPTDSESLRFLVHFVGDVHQPLHLTSRERGGNGDPVLFEGRHMSLHGLWDTGLISKSLREQTNYTRPLPAKQIEGALRGTIYDPYIRLILWEGVRIWWRSSLRDWLSCPSSLTRLASRYGYPDVLLPRSSSAPLTPAPSARKQTFWSAITDMIMGTENAEDHVCAYAWARTTHDDVTCQLVFPDEYDQHQPAKEVHTPEYYGPIKDSNVIEKLLAQAGLRLAAIINSIYAPDETAVALDGGALAPLNLDWLAKETK